MNRTKNFFLIIMTLMVSLMLIGCSSEATTETVKSEPEAVVKEEAPKVEEVVETKVSEEVTVEEPSAEEIVVEEPADALYIPEGIDMESTLPGEEWVASFVGNVAEPVVVIYNDNSGRKEVVQANSELTVNPDEDTFAVYFQETNMGATPYSIAIKEIVGGSNYFIYTMDPEKMREIRKRNGKIVVRGGAEDWVIEFKIIVK